jgi:beta-mannosidase
MPTTVLPSNTKEESLCLNGQWQFRQYGDKEWLAAQVPGCNFSDLLNNLQINDPFHRNEESQLQWIEKHDWEYRKLFNINESMLAVSALDLVFAGLDTYCDVYLNDVLILQSNNMFVGHKISCKQWLTVGENTLHIIFRSPINEVMPIFRDNGFTYPAENDKSEERLSVFTRKAPYHYGWDWGPRFVTSGIWRSVSLEVVNQVSIDDVYVQQEKLSEDLAQLNFQISLTGAEQFNGTIHIECLNINGLSQRIESQQIDIAVVDHNQSLNIPLVVDNPNLWWPNGLGDAFLYQFKVSLFSEQQCLDAKELSIGLRTIEVINEKDEFGESFYLKVNGQPTFMKGANYIPSDSFLDRVSSSKYEKIFDDAVAANMNMLRVWGGGIYENDEFYQLADQRGILIWQDFMFACSLYPADDDFLNTVADEVEYNVKRLRNHACIALWCGNNETEMGIEFWQWPTTFNYSDELYRKLKQDYSKLFKTVLPELVERFDPERFYFSSSPIGYWENKEDDNRGDNHYWGVWHGEEPFSEFKQRVPRFMSEFGFQSFPIMDSVKKYSIEEDWHIDSAVMKSHQKHPRGNSLIRQYMKDEYQDPKDFESFLYLSQVQQALGLKIAFEAHRSAMPFCMGTLYWQFNDCWPVASWSGIDYYGRWKALHYQAQRCFKNIAVFVEEGVNENDDALMVNIVCDKRESETLKLTEQLMTLDGQQLWTQQIVIETMPLSSEVYSSKSINNLLAEANKNDVVFVTYIHNINSKGEQGSLISEAFHYFTSTKDLNLVDANLTVHKSAEDNQIKLSLLADNLMRQVYVSIEDLDGNFSDNFFDLLPHSTKEISIDTADKTDQEVALLLEKIRIVSIVDTYQK